MKSPFEILDEKEMADTINEGTELLQSLESKMTDNTYILVYFIYISLENHLIL